MADAIDWVDGDDPPAARWAIVQRDAKTGQVGLILWSPHQLVSVDIQEAAMMRHPDILKVWRLEEIK